MADYDSSLPVRTENAGDVIAKLCDKTTTSNQLAIDNAGSVGVNQKESNGDITKAWIVKNTDGTYVQEYTANNEAKVSITDPIGQKTMSASVSVVVASDQSTLPVEIVEGAGDEIHFYDDAAELAADDSETLTYTVNTGKVFELKKIQGAASGKMRLEVKVGTTGSTETKLVAFNSTANPNYEFEFKPNIFLAAGKLVELVFTNYDKQAMNVYGAVMGVEKTV